ncbi:MAG: hypothetical protein M3478_13605 [Planctomycetota bacterium]|nr:hypothetical protein [Planctomycetota bacterium]
MRGFLDAGLHQDVRRRLDHYMREIAPVVPEGDRTFEPDGVTVRNLWRMEQLEQHDPYFVDFAERPAVLVFRGAHTRHDPELKAAYDAARAVVA